MDGSRHWQRRKRAIISNVVNSIPNIVTSYSPTLNKCVGTVLRSTISQGSIVMLLFLSTDAFISTIFSRDLPLFAILLENGQPITNALAEVITLSDLGASLFPVTQFLVFSDLYLATDIVAIPDLRRKNELTNNYHNLRTSTQKAIASLGEIDIISGKIVANEVRWLNNLLHNIDRLHWEAFRVHVTEFVNVNAVLQVVEILTGRGWYGQPLIFDEKLLRLKAVAEKFIIFIRRSHFDITHLSVAIQNAKKDLRNIQQDYIGIDRVQKMSETSVSRYSASIMTNVEEGWFASPDDSHLQFLRYFFDGLNKEDIVDKRRFQREVEDIAGLISMHVYANSKLICAERLLARIRDDMDQLEEKFVQAIA